jgi:phosphoglycolate phosphatase-like HAD superfamily hydrolase
LGTKTEHIKLASGGKYAPRHVLMIGDAPGDFKAAKANHALFFPIVPGHEEAWWQRLFDEGIDRFLTDRFAGDYEAELLRAFNASLPEKPHWQH